MYGKNLDVKYGEKAMEKELCDKMLYLGDAYVSTEQSKVIVDVLTKLYQIKAISDHQYARGLNDVLDTIGFERI